MPKTPTKAKPYKKRPLNDVQKKYWDVQYFNKGEGWQWEEYSSYSHYKCTPTGVLQKYASKPLSCFDKQNYLCPIYKDALVGKMPEDVLALYVDATEVEDNPVDKATKAWKPSALKLACRFHVRYEVPNRYTSTGWQHNLFRNAFLGLGFAQHKEGVQRMVTLLEHPLFSWSLAKDVLFGAYYSGDVKLFEQAAKSILRKEPKNQSQQRTLPPLRKYVVDLAHQSKSDVAKQYCQGVVKGQPGDLNSCIFYLAEIRDTSSSEAIFRHFGKHQNVVVRALGILQYKPAKAKIVALARGKKSANSWTQRINLPALVAAINMGERSFWPTLQLHIEGYYTTKQKGSKRDRRVPKLASHAIMESAYMTDSLTKKKLAQVLSGIKDKSSKKEEHVWASSQIVLAQHNVTVNGVIEALSSPDEKIRQYVLTAIGGIQPSLRNGVRRPRYHGTRYVRGAALVPALLSFYDKEAKKALKQSSLEVAASIRAMSP